MLEITLRISTENVQKFTPNYLAERPIPLDENEVPIMSQKEWFKKRTITDIMKVCRRGRDKLALQAVQELEGLIE